MNRPGFWNKFNFYFLIHVLRERFWKWKSKIFTSALNIMLQLNQQHALVLFLWLIYLDHLDVLVLIFVNVGSHNLCLVLLELKFRKQFCVNEIVLFWVVTIKSHWYMIFFFATSSSTPIFKFKLLFLHHNLLNH